MLRTGTPGRIAIRRSLSVILTRSAGTRSPALFSIPTASLDLGLAPRPAGDADGKHQQQNSHASGRGDCGQPLLDDRHDDGPYSHAQKTAGEAKEKTVPARLQGREVEKAGPGRVGRDDEDVVVARRQA